MEAQDEKFFNSIYANLLGVIDLNKFMHNNESKVTQDLLELVRENAKATHLDREPVLSDGLDGLAA